MVRNLLITTVFTLMMFAIQAQNKPVHPTEVITGKYLGMSKPLRDIPAMTAEEFHEMELKGLTRTLNKDLKNRVFPFSATALPKGTDPAWQNFMGTTNRGKAPILNFDGQTSPYYPPDCNGTAGPNHFMQTINTVYAIYNKSGALVAGPTNMNLLFGSVPGANRNDGDPIILYDDQADRWLATEFSIPFSGPNYMLMAVSTTNDPTGTWYQYSFQVASMPDYPKFSVWRDGYYMGDNNSNGNDIYVFQREQMLTGGTALAVGFNNPWRPTSIDGFMCVPPIDNDGPLAPSGTPGMFIAFNDDALGGGSDQLWLYDLTVDWTTPANSTFIRTQQIDVQPFNSNFGNNWNNIEQKGTSQRVDGIPQVIMNVPQYRNFDTHQTIVCCHTVNIDGIRHAGIRWYELRKTTGNWEVRQQGTYAPDAHSRWMGSIMLNGYNEIGMGYSVSSLNMFPSIYFCGQSAGEFANATGILDITEDTILVGTNSQTGANRWGDYAQMSVDPTDDKTFWFTTEYIGNGGSRKTRIASFKYNFAPEVTTLPASAIMATSATLNGTVNPNGIPTDYHFEYGNTPVSLNYSTPTLFAGSGSINVSVSADLTGLLSDTNYFFRIVAESAGGSATGLKVKFSTPAAPFIAVTPPNQNVPAWTGNTQFLVASNTTWTVESDAPWCTVTTSGIDNDTIMVAYDENLSVGLRIANITVTGLGAGAQTVAVTQEGAAPMLSVTPPNQNVSSPAGNTQFGVISNTTWSVVSDASWCTVTPAGSNNGTIVADFETNVSASSRMCTITVTAPGLASETVTLTQAGAAPTLSVSPVNQNVSATAGSTAFSVASNANWVVTGNASWCTVTSSGSGNGTIVADYSQNTADQPRTANIEVTVSGLAPQTVTVTQAKSSIGVEENIAQTIRIYPNPTRGIFNIVPGSADFRNIEVTVQDLNGKIFLNRQFKGEKEYQIDLSSASQGTYNIILKTDASLLVKKLVVIK
ncbi:MAG: BACON domain-containing carbohydrate-binding protein [Bacteroidales bacterium]|nr:BACON domain-containing carbohydrate-binding protein [Bacteroidales bacterium]